MPAKTVIATDVANTSVEDLERHLQSICRKHLKALHEIRVERRNRGLGSGPISSTIEVGRDDGETDDELLRSTVDEVVKLVTRDAQQPRGRNTKNAGRIAAWEGDVVLMDAKSPPKELARVPVSIEDPEAFASFELEGIALIGAAGKLVDGMRKIVVDLGTTFVKREKAMNKLVRQVAKSSARVSKSAAKWHYKTEKVAAEAASSEARATQAAQQTRARMEALASLGDSMQDTLKVWSEFIIRSKERKPGEPKPSPPARPTQAELDAFFGDEAFEVDVDVGGERHNARSVSAQMIAESDFQQRFALSKILVAVLKSYPEEVQQRMVARGVQVLGMARALELKAWFSAPLL